MSVPVNVPVRGATRRVRRRLRRFSIPAWIVVIGAVLFTGPLWYTGAEDSDSADDPFGIDSLFEDPPPERDDEDRPAPDEQVPETDVPALPMLDRVQQRDPVRIGGSIRFVGGYSLGWTDITPGDGEYEDLSVIDLRSRIDLFFAISPVMRVTKKFQFTYPEYELSIRELAIEYDFEDYAFLTVGHKRFNWGRSDNFRYTNILHRQADTPLSSANTQNNLVSRVVVPLGIGGVELIAQSKDEYHEDPGSPQGDRLGVGVKYDYARERLDIDIGAYYQRGLKGRLFVSGTTTVTDWLELYAEGVAVDARFRSDDTGPYAGEEEPTTASGEPIKDGWVEIAPDKVLYDNNPDYGASVGVVLGLFNNNLELNGEYYYNGEETELSGAGRLYWGHNLALNADFSIPNTPLRLRMGYRYSHTFNSSFFVPRLTADLMRHITMDVTGGFLWGPDDAGYGADNPDDLDRPAFVTITFTINGSI